MLGLVTAVPKAAEAIKTWAGKPSADDMKTLHAHVKWLNERRAFYVGYESEAVELVNGSVQDVIEKTGVAHAALTHPASQAALGLILDGSRRFNDRWSRFRTPPWWTGHHLDGRRQERSDLAELRAFYEDLGALRQTVREAVEFLRKFVDPKLKTDNLTPPPPDEDSS